MKHSQATRNQVGCTCTDRQEFTQVATSQFKCPVNDRKVKHLNKQPLYGSCKV